MARCFYSCSSTSNSHVLSFKHIANGGEEGIRTLDALLTHTPLAGERLRPLGHLSTFGHIRQGAVFPALNSF